ncbi:MAG: hypothetical protein IKZ42_08060 [Clostridiales bacterium]|nr:hypothetical protein [Clostridiales bacterium]
MNYYNLFKLAFLGAAVVLIIIGISSKSKKKRTGDNFVAQFKQQHPFVDAAAGVMITDYEEVVVNRDTTFKLWKVRDIAYVNVDSSLNRVSQPQRYFTFLDANKNVIDGQLFAPQGAVVENYQNSNHIGVVGDNQVRDVVELLKRHNSYIKLMKDGVEQV